MERAQRTSKAVEGRESKKKQEEDGLEKLRHTLGNHHLGWDTNLMQNNFDASMFKYSDLYLVISMVLLLSPLPADPLSLLQY